MSASPNGNGAHKPLVLVVESDRTIRSAAARTLLDAGYCVDIADCIGGMMLALERSRPDVLVVESHFPDGDFLTRAEGIRKLHPQLKIITTSTRRHIPALAQNAGLGYLHKPFGVAALRRAVEDALRPTAATLEESAHFHITRFLAAGLESNGRRHAHADAALPSRIHERIMAEVEKPLLEIFLRHTGGNQLRAARLLGLNRNTLRKKIRHFGIDAREQAKAGR